MSWETFKQNILRVANNPDGIPNIETIADLYANEYDAAIKGGFDTINGTKVIRGDVAAMKQLFLSALQKGLTSTEPYDLVGEMGAGVKAYWATAILGNDIVPKTPAIGAISNVSVTSNIANSTGVWQRPLGGTGAVSSELTPEQRVDFQEQLETATQRHDELNSQGSTLKAETYKDEINKFTGILEQNQNARVDVPPPRPSASDVLGVRLDDFEDLPTPQPAPVPANPTSSPNVGTGGSTSTTVLPLDDDEDPVVSNNNLGVRSTEDDYVVGTFNQGKPFVTGFRAGGGGGGSYFGGSYVPFTAFSGNMSLGEKAVAIAVYDASQNVKEVGIDTGHPRIIQMQALGGAKIGGGTGFAWCGCAVSTWWTEAEGQNNLKNSSILASHPNPAWVPDWVSWGIKTGRYVDMRNPANSGFVPKPGDAIIYDNGIAGVSNHIGIFWKIEGGFWYGVDGNFGRAIKTHKLNNLSQVQGVVRI